MGGSPCIECGSTDTELLRSEDGHFRKVCHGCGYVGGPYVSDTSTGGQTRLGRWTD